MNGIMKGINGEEILTCLILVAIGYFIAMMFSRMCSCGNGFRIGAGESPSCMLRSDQNLCEESNKCKWVGCTNVLT